MFLKTLEDKVGGVVLKKWYSFIPRHQPKAEDPIDVTLLGIVSTESDEQPLNAYEPIDVIFSGNTIEVSDLQLVKIS